MKQGEKEKSVPFCVGREREPPDETCGRGDKFPYPHVEIETIGDRARIGSVRQDRKG
jgi:hypothetical protein